MTKQCCDCRDAEHDNIDNDVRLTIVREPSGKFLKRGYLCAAHTEMYSDDGYTVTTSS